jgi:hypothetical protein
MLSTGVDLRRLNRRPTKQSQFATDWGTPGKVNVDGATEQVGQNTEFIKRCRTYDINLFVSSPVQHRERPVEENLSRNS